MSYFVYILRTSSNTLYIGQTNNLEKRTNEHKNKSSKSAKYIRYFSSLRLVYSEEYQTRTEAMKRESQLKKWAKAKKEALITGNLTEFDKEESVKKELQIFRSAVEQTADSIFITDSKGVIEYVNPSFEKMTGFSKKEALGKTPSIIKSGLQSVENYKKLWSTILSGKTFRATVINKRRDGKLFYADHTITPIKDKKGDVIHFVGIWKDITKNIELEKRSKEFVAIASHELKTPITTIKSYSQLLMKKLAQNEDKDNLDFVRQINSQADKLTKLIGDFLDINKIEAGKLVIEKKTFDLDLLVDKIVSDFQYAHNSHQIIRFGKVNRRIFGDPIRIEQVVINLLTNAVKYSPKSKEVIIRLKSNKDKVTLSVTDFGIGIAKTKLKKIFDRFFRVNEKDQQGFGLGLYISSEIIKRHKGSIWVESVRGKGSTFYFTLPLV